MPINLKVIRIISETLNVPENKIRENDKLVELTQDSIQLFELLIRFEKELGRKVSYEDIADIERVGDVIQYAYAHQELAAI